MIKYNRFCAAARQASVPLLGCASAVALGLASPALAQQELLSPQALAGDVVVTAGEFVVERPTLENLGFEWFIKGDANRNAVVKGAYRKRGDAAWREALPMLRLQGEDASSPTFRGAFTYIAPNMFAGSVFDLEPGTTYEVRFTLSDPDGVLGTAEVVREVTTRPVPKPAADGRVFHVYPYDYAGPRQEPSFGGLMEAYFDTLTVGGDWHNVFPPRVRPGDTILVHAGVYKDKRRRYGHESQVGFKACCGTTWDGTFYLNQPGTPDRPIVIKGAGDGEVVFDGDGNTVLFNVMAADYTYFEGITFRNTMIAIQAGQRKIAGAKGLTVVRSKFDHVGAAVHTDWSGSQDFYIADNEMVGLHDPSVLMGWAAGWFKVPGFDQLSDNLSQYAVKVYGPGHVVAYNRVRNFHDGIDHATYGNPDNYPNTPFDRQPSSIDIIGNDISNVHDNCVETDGAMHNVRVMRNLCVNSAAQAYSMQPLLGGPAYFIRNVAYNSPVSGAVKFSQHPAGGVFYHNTFLAGVIPGSPGGQASNVHFRNNLILRQSAEQPVLQIPTFSAHSSSDYNGFGIAQGTGAAFEWTTPKGGAPATTASLQPPTAYPSFAAYKQGSGQDRNSLLVDHGVFRNAPPIAPTAPWTQLYDPAGIDVTLRPRSAPVDRGMRLPNLNDGFTGKAPDLGAYELGKPAPHYGPRPPAGR